jgi:N-alpha-acetyltransferase 30
MSQDKCIGVIICKLDRHRDALRGYIAMLAVKKEYRKRKIGLYFNQLNYLFLLLISFSIDITFIFIIFTGTTLVKVAINAMKKQNADEVR